MAPDQGWSSGHGDARARHTRTIEQTDGVVRVSAGGPLSYIKHVLQPGETVRYQGSTHWIPSDPAYAGWSRHFELNVGCVPAVWDAGRSRLLNNCIRARGPRLVEALDDGDFCYGSARDFCPRLL